MNETIYNEENVSNNVRLFFEQLLSEFGKLYEIWVCKENFDRNVEAGVVNRKTGNSVRIHIQIGNKVRNYPFNKEQIEIIHRHLSSNESKQDLLL